MYSIKFHPTKEFLTELILVWLLTKEEKRTKANFNKSVRHVLLMYGLSYDNGYSIDTLYEAKELYSDKANKLYDKWFSKYD